MEKEIDLILKKFEEYLKNPSKEKFYSLFALRNEKESKDYFNFINSLSHGQYDFNYPFYSRKNVNENFPKPKDKISYGWNNDPGNSTIIIFPAYFKLKIWQFELDFGE